MLRIIKHPITAIVVLSALILIPLGMYLFIWPYIEAINLKPCSSPASVDMPVISAFSQDSVTFAGSGKVLSPGQSFRISIRYLNGYSEASYLLVKIEKNLATFIVNTHSKLGEDDKTYENSYRCRLDISSTDSTVQPHVEGLLVQPGDMPFVNQIDQYVEYVDEVYIEVQPVDEAHELITGVYVDSQLLFRQSIYKYEDEATASEAYLAELSRFNREPGRDTGFTPASNHYFIENCISSYIDSCRYMGQHGKYLVQLIFFKNNPGPTAPIKVADWHQLLRALETRLPNEGSTTP